jgi:hypothetical protein
MSTKQNHTNTWSCPSCTTSNPTNVIACQVCNGPPFRAIEHSKLPPKLRAPSWRCARWSTQHYVFPHQSSTTATLLWTMNERTAPDDWLFTSSWDPIFLEQLLSHGLFTIPDSPKKEVSLFMLPNPLKRYCLDLTLPAPKDRRHYHKSKEMRSSKRSQYRITVNKNFRKSLGHLMKYHNEREHGTWMTIDLIDLFEGMNKNVASRVKHWVFELWVLRDDTNGQSQQKSQKEKPKEEKEAIIRVRLVRLKTTSLNGQTGTRGQWNSDTGRFTITLDNSGERKNVKLENLEIIEEIDASSSKWILGAVTAGMSVGRAFHDYSMGTMIRDKRMLGHCLTKTVADILVKTGFKIWYWGYKNGYMSKFDHYGGKSFSRSNFWEKWQPLMVAEDLSEKMKSVVSGGKALIMPLEEDEEQKY